MPRCHRWVSICLSLAVLGGGFAYGQEASSRSRLLRSVRESKSKVEAVAKQPSQPLRPTRIEPRLPARKTQIDRRTTVPARNGRVQANRQPTTRPAPVKQRTGTSRQTLASKLKALDATSPYDFSGSRRYLVATQRNGRGLVLCDLQSQRRLRVLAGSNRRYTLVKISRDARWIAAVRRDNPDRVDVWRADNGRQIATLNAGGGAKRKLAFSARGNELQVTAAGGTGQTFSIPAGKLVGGFGASSGGAAVKKPTVQAPRPTPRVGAAPPRRPATQRYEPIKPAPTTKRYAAPKAAAPAPTTKRYATPKAATPAPTTKRYAAPKAATPAPTTKRYAAPKAARAEPKTEAAPTAERYAAPEAAAAEPTIAAPVPAPQPMRPPASPAFEAPAAPKAAAPRLAAPKRAAPRTAPPTKAAKKYAAPSRPAPAAAPVPAAEPRMGAPRTMMHDSDDDDDEPPAAAGASSIFDSITSSLPDTSSETSAEDTSARSDEPVPTFDAVGGALSQPAPEPTPASPAAPGDSNFAPRAESAAEAAPAAAEDEDPSGVTVHFATNRNRLATEDREWSVYFKHFFSTLPAFVIYALVVLAVLIFPWFGKRSWATYALATGVVVLCAMGGLEAYVRSELRDELTGELYGSRPVDLSYGVCEVSVPLPENRQAGELNRPVSVWVFEAPENPEKHFMLRQVTEHDDQEEFFASLSGEFEKVGEPAALLFIHGYNVSFEDAIFRTAQLSVDLEFKGAPILFSWPSYAEPVKYTFDEQNAEVSVPAFRQFLKDLAAKSGATRVHIIAHSMGNRVLAGALEKMDPESQRRNKKIFREVVLAAPDIDRRVFEKQVLPHIDENAQHCTLYASSRDRALLISHYFHNYQRLGETEPELVVAEGMDTIDASFVDTSLLGHSYIGDVQSIVTDLHHLVVRGKRPLERLGLETLERGGLPYWTIKPQLETAADPSTRR